MAIVGARITGDAGEAIVGTIAVPSTGRIWVSNMTETTVYAAYSEADLDNEYARFTLPISTSMLSTIPIPYGNGTLFLKGSNVLLGTPNQVINFWIA